MRLDGLRHWIDTWPRAFKRAVMVLADVVMLPLALWSAFALRLGTPTPDVFTSLPWWLFAAVILLTLPVFQQLGLYRAVVRYIGGQAMRAVLGGVTFSALLLVAFSFVSPVVVEIPRSVPIIYWGTALIYVGGSRYLVRALLLGQAARRSGGEPVILYGAGAAGLQSALALRGGGQFEPVAFVDDDPGLHGSEVSGLRVYPPFELPRLIDRFKATEVLLAMPSAGRGRRREIIGQLEPLAVHVKTLPTLADLVSGDARLDEFQEVAVEDLLGRDPVPPREDLLAEGISGKTVMVTGAGGSIGSELCRQILRLEPMQLLLYEISEYQLYRVERELRTQAASDGIETTVVPLLGNIANRQRLEQVMAGFGVHTVYHAAAYKHVPLVEHNLIEGVRNNVFGTLRCARAAMAAGVASFVLISTDKAVRPTNVMGASKRMAELVLQGLSESREALGHGTRFTMVRFGNVLGSSGSVVPLFREQIRAGGPVTVTHPEVTRYFMTIPEAAELVLQAGSMGEGGDVFVLDMGEPVRIFDLARRMIRLTGYEVRDEEHPHGDITITFSGLRPGEKLYEELLLGEAVESTDHPMICRARELSFPWPELEAKLEELDAACQAFDCPAARQVLAWGVCGFGKEGTIVDWLWQHQRGETPAVQAAPFHLH